MLLPQKLTVVNNINKFSIKHNQYQHTNRQIITSKHKTLTQNYQI